MIVCRRYVAFSAVLFACLVMVVHAVVPHHHRASDLTVCIDSLRPCEHTPSMTSAFESTCVLNAPCCGCHGVTCAVSRPFTLRNTADEERSVKPAVQALVQYMLWVANLWAAVGENPSTQRKVSWWITDARLQTDWLPTTLAGRAPPVLLFS